MFILPFLLYIRCSNDEIINEREMNANKTIAWNGLLIFKSLELSKYLIQPSGKSTDFWSVFYGGMN